MLLAVVDVPLFITMDMLTPEFVKAVNEFPLFINDMTTPEYAFWINMLNQTGWQYYVYQALWRRHSSTSACNGSSRASSTLMECPLWPSTQATQLCAHPSWRTMLNGRGSRRNSENVM